MYREIVSSVLMTLSVAGGFAQTEAIGNSLSTALRSKMGLSLIDKLNATGMAKGRKIISAKGEFVSDSLVGVIVRMHLGEDASVLTQYGLKIKSSAMGFASVGTTVDQLLKAAADPRVKHMSLPRYGRLFLDKAHPRTGVDRISIETVKTKVVPSRF